MAAYSILPEDIRGARESDYSNRLYMTQPRLAQRRRFWLEFSVLPHYPSKRALKNMRRLEKKHRNLDKTNNDYDLHDVPAVRFPQFARLPPEIRLVIWEYALHQPRIVVVTSKYEDYLPPLRTTLYPLLPTLNHLNHLPPISPPPPTWTPPPAQLPALMATCRESYDCAIKFYQRAFDWRVPHVLVDEGSGTDSFSATRGYGGRGLGFFDQFQSTPGQQTQTLPPLSTLMQLPAERGRPGGPGCWFNFDYDSIFLKGALEPCLEAASTSMVYFLPQQDTKRVRYVACNADDLGVGDLMANHLYARLFPVIDRFEIKKCLNVVSPPRIHRRSYESKSESRHHRRKDATAAEVLTTAATIAVTQRNPSGIGYDEQGRPRLNDTQASCMAVHAADLNPYSGNMNGLDSYDMSNNVCQQVWDQWTNSQGMARKTAGGHRHRHSRSATHAGGNGSGGGSGSYMSDSGSDSDSGSESETSSCFCDIETAISAEPEHTHMAIDEDDGEESDGEESDREESDREESDREESEDVVDYAGPDTDGMDVDDTNESPDADADAMPVGWPPLGWGAMAVPHGDHAIHDPAQNGEGVQNAQEPNAAPAQESMRIVMVTEDLLQGTIMTIEKIQRYASKFGK